MSTSSKPRCRAPTHANRFAFKHNKNSKLTKQIALVETDGLCRRCAEKIEWRKRYRKYKPLSAPRKCNKCDAKKIKAAYRTICPDCAFVLQTCQGCAHVPVEVADTNKSEIKTDAARGNTADGTHEETRDGDIEK